MSLKARVARLEQKPTEARLVVLVLDESDPQSVANYGRRRATVTPDDFLVTIIGEDPDKDLEPDAAGTPGERAREPGRATAKPHHIAT